MSLSLMKVLFFEVLSSTGSYEEMFIKHNIAFKVFIIEVKFGSIL